MESLRESSNLWPAPPPNASPFSRPDLSDGTTTRDQRAPSGQHKASSSNKRPSDLQLSPPAKRGLIAYNKYIPVRRTKSTSRPAQERKQPKIPELPVELWLMIVEFATESANPRELCQAYINLKNLSMVENIRAATQTVFMRMVRKEFKVKFDMLSPQYLYHPTWPLNNNTELGSEFVGFSEDQTRVVLRCVAPEGLTTGVFGNTAEEERKGWMEDWANLTMNEWKNHLRQYLSALKQPKDSHHMPAPYIITFGLALNDTELPELEFDFDKMDFSFNWAGMLDKFLEEEHYVRSRVPDYKAYSPGYNYFDIIVDTEDGFYRQVRRLRNLSEYFSGNVNMPRHQWGLPLPPGAAEGANDTVRRLDILRHKRGAFLMEREPTRFPKWLVRQTLPFYRSTFYPWP